MADKTGIEWTDATWNPIVGCSVVSPGCTNCYAMRQAARIETMQPGSHYAGTVRPSKAGPVWTGKVVLAPPRILHQPLRWRRGRKIFVNSMGDIFHEDVPDEWIDRVFAIMALTPQHTYQVLTKRSARMRAYMTAPGRVDRWVEASWPLGEGFPLSPQEYADRSHCGPPGRRTSVFNRFPLPNVWIGVSTEDQRRADERLPDLLATPAAVRFVSAEPLLGPINFRRVRIAPDHHTILDALDGYAIVDSIAGSGQERARLDWVIVGGESGPHARPMHPGWVRSIRGQCAAADVPFLFKQWGEWLDEQAATASGMAPGPEMLDRLGNPTGRHWHPYEASDRNGGAMIRVGKHRAGRLLDGVEHNGFPEGCADD